MANRYWVGGSGDWSDNTNHWSISTGGSAGASKPTSADSIFIDASSGAPTIEVDETANCLDFDWTGCGVGSTLTLTGDTSYAMNIYGSMILAANATLDKQAGPWGVFYQMQSAATDETITQNGANIDAGVSLYFKGNGKWTLQDELTVGSTSNGKIEIDDGEFDTNDQTVNIYQFWVRGGTLTLGSSTINMGTSNFSEFEVSSAAGSTVNAETSLIKVNGGYLDIDKSITLNDLEFVSGSSCDINLASSVVLTINELKINPGTTVNFEDSETVACTTIDFNGSSGNLITLRSASSDTQWDLTVSTSSSASYCDVKDSNASGAGTPIDNTVGGVDNGNNNGWGFPRSLSITEALRADERIREFDVDVNNDYGQNDFSIFESISRLSEFKRQLTDDMTITEDKLKELISILSDSSTLVDFIKNNTEKKPFDNFSFLESFRKDQKHVVSDSLSVSDKKIAWYDSDWKYRIKITIQNDQVDSDLSNFPVYVDLSDLEDAFFNSVKSDGSDIRITQANGTTLQAREIVTVDTSSKTGEMHFKASSLSNTINTDFYIYYGNTTAFEPAEDATYGSENVWDTNFKMVQHLNEDPSGGAPQSIDSTSNDVDGYSQGSMASEDLVDGKIGKCLDFNGSQSVRLGASGVPTPLKMGTGSFTMSIWANYGAGIAQYDRLIGIGTNAKRYELYMNTTTQIGAAIDDAVTKTQANQVGSVDTSWHLATVVRDRTNDKLKLYIDGEFNTESQDNTNNSIDEDSGAHIGRLHNLASYLYAGQLDEARISDIARTAEWIKTGFNNQNSTLTFYSLDTQEAEVQIEIIVEKILDDIFSIIETNIKEKINLLSDSSSLSESMKNESTKNILASLSILELFDRDSNYKYNISEVIDVFDEIVPWYDSDWDYRIKLTIQNSKVDDNLTDFPVYIDLSDLPANFFNNVKGDGSDIRITRSDGITEHAREVVSITTGSSIGELHFKANNLSSSSNTNFYIYYGNSLASEPAVDAAHGRNNVWTNNYTGVWHLEEDGDGSLDEYVDSTGNSNDGQGGGGTPTNVPTQVPGQMGNSQDFNADNINFGDNLDLEGTDNISISMWLKRDANASWMTLASKRTAADGYRGYFYGIQSSTKPYFYIGNNTSTLNYMEAYTTTYPITLNNYHHLYMTYDGSEDAYNVKFYIDKLLGTTLIYRNTLSDTTVNDKDALFGKDGAGTNYMAGIMDEMRFASIDRTIEWISTEYNNQYDSSTFYSVGDQKTETKAISKSVSKPISENILILLLTKLLGYQKEVIDSFLLNETFTKETEKILTSSISILELLTKSINITIDDMFTLLETSSLNVTRILSDIFSISAILSKKEYELRQTDIFNIVELLFFSEDIVIFSTLGLSETLRKTFNFSIDDSLTITEALERIFTFKRNLLDIINIAELISKKTGTDILDSFNLAEIITLSTISEIELSEVLNIIKSLTKESTIKQTETVLLIEQILKNINFKKIDSFILSELFTKETKKILTTSINLVESLLKDIDISINDVFALLETSSLNVNRVLIDIFTLSTILSKKEQELRTTDIFNLSEILNINSSINIIDAFNFIELLSKEVGFSISDSFLIVETLQRLTEYKKDLSVVIQLTETITKKTGKNIIESFSFAEQILYLSSKTILDTVALSELLEKQMGLSIDDAFILSEGLITKVPGFLTITEQIIFIENIVNETDLVLSDALAFIENLSINFPLIFIEAITILEQFFKALGKEEVEVVNITENLFKENNLIRQEQLNVIEIKKIISAIQQTETVTLSETFSKLSGMSKVESLSLVESFKKALSIDKVELFNILENSKKESSILFTELLNIIETNVISSDFILSELIQTAESFLKTIGKNNVETLSTVEALIKQIIAKKQEFLSITEIKKFTYELNKIANIAILEQLSLATGMKQQEIITLQEVFKKAVDFKLEDNITFSIELLKAINIPFTELVNIIENSILTAGLSVEEIEQFDFTESLSVDGVGIKKLTSAISILDNIKFDAELRKNSIFIISDQIIPGHSTTIEDGFNIEEQFSRNVSIGIIDIEELSETLIKDFGMIAADSVNISEIINSTGEVEPLKRKTYLFSKGNKTYLFHRMK